MVRICDHLASLTNRTVLHLDFMDRGSLSSEFNWMGLKAAILLAYVYSPISRVLNEDGEILNFTG